MTLRSVDVQQRFYPETAVGGFSQVDGSIEFYSRVAALIQPHFRVLDFGAGRGGHIENDTSEYRRNLKILRGRVAHVEGADIDHAVLDNPHVDHATMIKPGVALPFADAEFDLILANYVFEHVEDPEAASRELLRILKPGGYICATTPNKWGYVAIAASLVANRSHSRMLKKVQPDRLEFDVFPTCYRMNTPSALRRYFGGQADVVVYSRSNEPAYHFNSGFLYGAFKALHRLLPSALQTVLHVFIRKRD